MTEIIGLSCRFPESNGPAEFWTNLIDGTDMLTTDDRRWPIAFQGLPPRSGKAPGFDKFDAAFFSVHGKQAQKMDPQLRKLLEVAYEAWVDAGIDFRALRGSERVGVYVGSCGSEIHAQWVADIDSITGYEQAGCARSMFANRLSWWFDFHGPSKCIDTACSSSLTAFNDAISDFEAGRIDYAMVGGTSGIFKPQTSIAFQRLHMLSPDGTCKSFDASANGYARSDGIAAVVLRRPGLSEAPVWAPRRPYARVLACATNNDGHTKEGITFPSGPAQKALAQQVCAKAGLAPSAVGYIEAHGTGTVAGDGQELGAIEEWYGRAGARTPDNPLLIGSVKSNMGHCEGCSGLAGLIKVLLSYEHRTLPGNLHFKEPNPSSAGLRDGILKVITEPTAFEGIAALSNFGFGGTNVHLLLQGGGWHEPVAAPVAASEQSRAATGKVIPLACRTQEGMAEVVKILQGLPGGEESVVDPMRCWANSCGGSIARLSMRGTLIDGELRCCQAPTSAPPVWFIFTGNGSQWPRMAADLIQQNATFRRSIEACAAVIAPLGLDLLEALDREDGFVNNCLASVGLASVQVGLVDVLREEYGIIPGGVVGHSAGETACGYGDGCFSREQTVMVAYHRGRMCPDHGISGGLMAAVGLGAEVAEARLAAHGKDSCVIGCDNSPICTTLSGPEADLKPLLEQLKADGVFVRELDTRGLAYHSPILQPHLPELQAALEEVVPEPKERSATWLSSSYAVDNDSTEARLCSAAYQTHNYASRVQFRQACGRIPKGAILLEIGPHALMRSFLHQNRADLHYVPAMRKGNSAVETLKAAVAELWRNGVSVKWPVAWPAPSAAHELPRAVREALVSWDHAVDYPLPTFKDWTAARGCSGFIKTYKLGGEHAFLADHIVDGRILMPATSYLVAAWEALATQQEKAMAELPVAFEDVCILQAVQAQPGDNITLSVLLDRSHRFQVLQETDVIAEGCIKPHSAPAPAKQNCTAAATAEALANIVMPGGAEAAAPAKTSLPEGRIPCRSGIQYGPHFKMLQKRCIDGTAAVLRWDQCFIRLLDGMLQAGALGNATDTTLRIPTKIRHLEILDPSPAIPAGSQVMVDVDARLGICRTVICEVAGVELSAAPRRPASYKTLLKKTDFLPYGEHPDRDTARLAYYRQIRGYLRPKVEPAILAHAATCANGMPDHLRKVLALLEDFKEPAPDGAQLEAFLSAPSHHLARLIRDLFSEEASAATMQSPIQAIMQHGEHSQLYAQDPLMQGFHARHINHMLDIVCENQGQAGFSVAEIGAGTGGFTRQVFAELNQSPFSELRGYTATDITPGFGPNLLQMISNPKLDFKTWDVNKPAPASLGGPFNLILASNALHTCDNMADALANVHASLADGGFVLLYETTAAFTACLWGLDERTWKFTDEREYGLWIAKPRWHRLWAEAGFTQITEHWCPHESGALFLYRKLPSVPHPLLFAAPPLVTSQQKMGCWLQRYNSVLAAIDKHVPKEAAPAEGEEAAEPAKVRRRLWLHGNLRDSPGVIGLGRCARLEAHGDNLRWMLDAHHPSSAPTSCTGLSAKAGPKLSAEQMLAIAGRLDLVNNMFDNGVHGSLRISLVELDELENAAAAETAPKIGVHLDIASPGDISSFMWAHSQAPPACLLQCNVAFGALNFRDVMFAYGKLSKDRMSHAHGGYQIGLEFSGKDKASGKRVMGMTPQNSIATMVASRPHALWDVPDSWTLAQAATVPVAYATAYYALVICGRLRPRHRVLIHSAAGAVGLAATRICLARGCEVFATCGSVEKRAFLLEAFPALRGDRIGDSRSCAFEEVVMRETGAAGVHLALNSLAGDKLQATVRCLADGGRLLEIGKYDILQGTPLSMAPLMRNIAFEGVDLDRIVNCPHNIARAWEVHALLKAGLDSGEVVPLPLSKFSRREAADAFRFMAAGTHVGKVLIQMGAKADAAEAAAEKPEYSKLSSNFMWPARPAKPWVEQTPEAAEALGMAPAVAEEPVAKPVFFCRPDRSYIITGGLGGFGLALAAWLADRGACNLLLTSKRGMRTGGQLSIVRMLRSRGVRVEVSKLDVADLGEAQQIIALAEGVAPVGGIFHLAMTLQDRWMSNQTGESWNLAVIPKAHGAVNLDSVSRSLPHLEHFVIFTSVVSSIGNEGQGNYGYANSACDMLCMSRRAAGLPALALAWGPVDHVGYVAETLKGRLVGRVFEWLLPQPVDDCLRVLGSCLLGGSQVAPIMCSTAETLGCSSATCKEDIDLVEAVLSLMGLKAGTVSENDSLAALGIDSMQLVEVRAVVQKKLCRPVPLESIGTLTVAALRELASQV
ncbi:ketoacyl-synt-domain-containing protein [Coccomyxa subellipsoidea C-169]|uniref:Fatty acid synthase n=1 Tax=Coccomyxa subellipsoidea (strain C-169) TaxID=574566 RepID=I0YUY4_COCSC|nr:ketoacyl-synt-domain-containing protein [Coccomyxa subellipsoidea C-169]EIE22203.1 ketoacyl-synt-domain-containing protein [Coccomyxa subellipsoidea C-169]|eukprot:XP_005646747.1 ketoacyl-synt-domain-containing protein [Coccomyxa subellipsoidea C-169]